MSGLFFPYWIWSSHFSFFYLFQFANHKVAREPSKACIYMFYRRTVTIKMKLRHHITISIWVFSWKVGRDKGMLAWLFLKWGHLRFSDRISNVYTKYVCTEKAHLEMYEIYYSWNIQIPKCKAQPWLLSSFIPNM